MKESLTKQTILGFNIIMIGKGVNYISQLIVTMVLARLLSVESFGIIAICTMIISFAQILTNLGLGPALVQRKTIFKKHIYTALISSLFMSVLVYVIALATSDLLVNFYNISEYKDVYIVISFVFFLSTFSSFAKSLLQRNLEFKIISGIDVVSYSVGYALIGIILAINDFGVWALVYAIIAQNIMSFIFNFYFVIKIYKLSLYEITFSLTALKEMLSFGVGYSVGHIASYFSTNGDYMVIGKYFTSNILGYYSKAYQLITIPANFVGQALDIVLFPILSKRQEDKSKLSSIYLSSLNILTLFLFPTTVLLILLSDEIVLILLGMNWIQTADILRILSISLYFRMAYKITDSITRAVGAVYIRALIKIIFAIIVIIFSIVGSSYGIKTVSIMINYAIIINYIMNNILLYYTMGFDVKRFANIHIMSGVHSFVLFLILSIIKINLTIYLDPIIAIILISLIALLIYITSMKFFWKNLLSNETLELLKGILPRKLMKIIS